MTTPLTREIRQNKPFATVEEEVFLNVLRTGDVLLRAEVDVLRTADLSFPQYNVLRILRGAGPEGLPTGGIAERMVSRDPDLTRLLDRLERRGLVRRSRDSADRRVIIATITQAGIKLISGLDRKVSGVHRNQLSHMSPTQLKELGELLVLARNPTG